MGRATAVPGLAALDSASTPASRRYRAVRGVTALSRDLPGASFTELGFVPPSGTAGGARPSRCPALRPSAARHRQRLVCVMRVAGNCAAAASTREVPASASRQQQAAELPGVRGQREERPLGQGHRGPRHRDPQRRRHCQRLVGVVRVGRRLRRGGAYAPAVAALRPRSWSASARPLDQGHRGPRPGRPRHGQRVRDQLRVVLVAAPARRRGVHPQLAECPVSACPAFVASTKHGVWAGTDGPLLTRSCCDDRRLPGLHPPGTRPGGSPTGGGPRK